MVLDFRRGIVAYFALFRHAGRVLASRLAYSLARRDARAIRRFAQCLAMGSISQGSYTL
jgi:hypothetical protein